MMNPAPSIARDAGSALELLDTPPVPAAGQEQEGLAAFPSLRQLPANRIFARALEYVSYWLAWITVSLALLLSACFLGCILVQIFFRYVLGDPLAWTDETAIFLFAWTMLLFATVCVREHVHARFVVLIGALPTAIEAVVDRICLVLVMIFSAVVVYYSGQMVELVWGNTSPAVHYPMQILYIAIPIHGIAIIIHSATNLAIGPNRGLLSQEDL